eukprot:TRINITY_DN5088_c0_g1_i1.p1 TRINITY_DN5088_c0_g1~~TRINITY_DN5088_c0_g1_i1.p1  ORF type:complete len:445 (-),score=102.36 TRINITY_DN5088_c0_g1_i1:27-1361(-)
MEIPCADNQTMKEFKRLRKMFPFRCEFHFPKRMENCTIISIHSCILSSQSRVLQEMCLKHPTLQKNFHLLFSDSSVETFEKARFDIDENFELFSLFISSMEGKYVELNVEQILPFSFLAVKLGVERLIQIFSEYFCSNPLNASNVCGIYAFASAAKVSILETNCLEFVNHFSEEVFEDSNLAPTPGSFCSLDQELASQILKVAISKTKHIKIFNAIQKWGFTQLQKSFPSRAGSFRGNSSNLDRSFSSEKSPLKRERIQFVPMQELVQPLMKYFDYRLISEDDMNTKVLPSGLLKEETTIQIEEQRKKKRKFNFEEDSSAAIAGSGSFISSSSNFPLASPSSSTIFSKRLLTKKFSTMSSCSSNLSNFAGSNSSLQFTIRNSLSSFYKLNPITPDNSPHEHLFAVLKQLSTNRPNLANMQKNVLTKFLETDFFQGQVRIKPMNS